MNNTAKAKRHLTRARALSGHAKSSLSKIKESELIAKIRKDREIIWKNKFVTRT